MIRHTELGETRFGSSRRLKELINNGKVRFGGNRQLKIYGTLYCLSGKGMKTENRVFFKTEQEAKDAGYRPCGHCMREAYVLWKGN